MTANNKEDFLFQLHSELHRIGIDAEEDIFADFEEHFKASANEGLSEEETCRRLGDVKEIARGYLNMESSRINSLVARTVEPTESERPRVSLTKPGHSEPADLSLRSAANQSASEAAEPIREYTPEHLSEEIYPDSQNVSRSASQSVNFSQNTQNTNSAQSTHNAQSDNSAQNAQSNSAQGEPSVAQAFSTAGKAAADAFKTAGHAVAEAVNTDAVKGAVKGAGMAAAAAVASAVHTTAHNIKTEHNARKDEHNAQKASEDAIPRPQNTARECASDSREGYIPPQDKSQNINTKNKFTYESLKGKKPDVNIGKLIGAILLDVFLWSWLITTLASIAIALAFGAFPQILAAGFSTIFGALSYYFITRLFLGIAQILTGLIVLSLDILLIKGIVNIVKSVVIMHIKAIYNL